MSVSIVYADGGEAFYKNGTTYQVYGRTSISIPSGNDVEATGEDYFDCTGFTSNTYVLCAVIQVENTGSSSSSVSVRADIRYGSTVISTPINTTSTIAAGATKAFKTAIRYSVVSGYDDLNIRFIAADLDGSESSYYTFTVYTPPGSIDCYYGTGKGLSYGGGLVATFYEKDIDQTLSSWSALNSFEPYNSTSTFDLSICGVGSGVGCFAVYWENSYGESKSLSSTTLRLQAYKNGVWVDRKTKTLSGSISSGGYRGGYFDFSVLPGEIRTDATSYRVIGNWTVGTDAGNISSSFTISNLNIDDTTHDPGYMRVEGRNLYYTDGYGYKHNINGSIGSYVGTDKAGFIRIDSSEPLWINYISSNGFKCQTANFNQRYGGNVNVGSSRAGFTWVSSGTSASNARYCLCMIDPNGNKKRIINHGDS